MNRLIKYWKYFITWIKGLFHKSYKDTIDNEYMEDFQDHFDFGLYAHTAWFSFPTRRIPYAEIKAMGIDFVYEQLGVPYEISEALQEAKKAGIKVLLNGYYNVYKIAKSSLKTLLEKLTDSEENKGAFMGVLAYDEPHLEANGKDNADLTWIKEHIIDKYKECTDKGVCFLNCLPNYARQSQVLDGTYLPSEEYVDLDTYRDYVTQCAKISDVVCGDFYGPFEGKKKDLWIPYLKVMREVSRALNKPMWQFVSCTKQGGAVEPTEEVLKHRIILNLMYGAQSIIFFKMLDYNSTSSPYTTGTTKSPTYDMLKNILAENSDLRKLASLFKNAAVSNITDTEEAITATVTKNNRSYKVTYALKGQVLNKKDSTIVDNSSLGIIYLSNGEIHLSEGEYLIEILTKI